MKPTQTTLLFIAKPQLSLDGFAHALNRRLDIHVETTQISDGAVLCCHGDGFALTIQSLDQSLGADMFAGALDTVLAKPVLGPLSNALAHHSHHMTITLQSNDTETQMSPLTRLRILHTATSLIVEQYQPSAVHWGPSNQLLGGAQYLLLAEEQTPWVLLARAHIVETVQSNRVLMLDGFSDLLDRPIQVNCGDDQSLEECHAAALSFLRHSIDTDTPFPDGHSFGPKGSTPYFVKHLPVSADFPAGAYELSAFEKKADMSLDGPARPSGDPLLTEGSLIQAPSLPRKAAKSLRSTFFAPLAWRSGIVALIAVAGAVVIGAWTFLNSDNSDTAILQPAPEIQSTILDNFGGN